eukprot:130617-Rhodomonas_salina.3
MEDLHKQGELCCLVFALPITSSAAACARCAALTQRLVTPVELLRAQAEPLLGFHLRRYRPTLMLRCAMSGTDGAYAAMPGARHDPNKTQSAGELRYLPTRALCRIPYYHRPDYTISMLP